VGPDTDASPQDLTTRADDEARFEEIYRSYRSVLHDFCERRLRDHAAASDVANETLLRCWKHRDSLDPKTLPGWLFRVARNLCTDTVRARNKWLLTGSPVDEPRPYPPDSPGLDVWRLLADALGRLSHRQRRLIQLHYLDGVGYKELAVEMCATVEAVRVSMFRARHQLLAQFAHLGLDEDGD
jgi:RNA polymerase sigma-70 factor (ECF subfamily)